MGVRLAASHMPADVSVDLPDLSIGELLQRAVEACPDGTALVDGTLGVNGLRGFSYREVWDHANRVARALLAHADPGQRVAILAPSTPEWLAAEYGAALAGMALVPLNTSLGVAALQYMLDDADVVAVLVGDNDATTYRQRVDEAGARSNVDRPLVDVSIGAALWSGDVPAGDLPTVGSEALALIQYTSGTTGAPKGVVLTHRGAVANGVLSARQLELPEHATWLNPLPLYHVNGTIFFGLGALWQASTQVVTRFDPATILDLVEHLEIDFMTGVPTSYIAMMEDPSFAAHDLSSLQLATTGGTVVPPDLVRRIEERFGVELMVVYGQTEAGSMITATRRGDTVEHKSQTAGAPLARTEVQLVDRAGAVVPCGDVGEICVRAPSVMQGYLNMPEATRETIDGDGWLHTGDLGTMTDSGHVQITGRLRDVIIRGGENIYPREIEDVLDTFDDVLQVAVVAYPHEFYGEEVAAVLRLRSGTVADPQVWGLAVTDALSRRKVPKRWFVVDEMPMTASGKVQKFELAAAMTRGTLPEVTV